MPQLDKFLLEFQNLQCFALEFDSDIVSYYNSVYLLFTVLCCVQPLARTYHKLINRVAPIESGVVVPAKVALRDVVTSASPAFPFHSWAVPSSRVARRNRFGECCATLSLALSLLVGFAVLGETSINPVIAWCDTGDDSLGIHSSESWGEYIQTSGGSASTASADAGPVPHGNTVSNSTEGPASPGRFPYKPDELIGGDSVLSIQRRLLASKRFPSAEEIDFARMQAEDLFEVKVHIIQRMEVLDPTGDWLGRGARALDSPNSATGESSLKKLYSFLEDLNQNGRTSRTFFSLSEKVALKKDNLDAGSSA
jgi:hypothetical protein